MISKFYDYDTVRVLCVPVDSAQKLWEGSIREPRVGDIGTIVEINNRTPLLPKYVIECVSRDGRTIWMAEFESFQLELVSRP